MSTTLYDTARAVISRIERDHRRELAAKEQALRSQASANAELLVENGELRSEVHALKFTDGKLRRGRKALTKERDDLARECNELQALTEACTVVIARLTDGTIESARKLVSAELAEMGVGV